MKVEIMIYVYFAICVSMIAYNIVYVFILKHRNKAIVKDSEKIGKLISEQLSNIEQGLGVSEKHKKYLCKILEKTAYITAFDKALEDMYSSRPQIVEKYFYETYSVFEYLTRRYMGKDTIKIAYFPYILDKYNILLHDKDGEVTRILMDLLRSVNIYCRENSLKAIYSTKNEKLAVDALKIIDKNLTFHHPKLICDGLLTFSGDRDKLRDCLLQSFDAFSIQMKLNILNFFRFGNVRCDDVMLSLLRSEKTDSEIRFSSIRYFEKFPNEEARHIIQCIAENLEGRSWEYQAIASSALKSYPDDVTFRILVSNLSSSNWHVRQNSAISCEKLGYTYHDLINVFDGNDRYAREIIRYRLDKRKAEEMEAKA